MQNPNDFKEKTSLANQELKDLKNTVLNTIENKGKDERNFIELLNNQRRATTAYNLLTEDVNNALLKGNTKETQEELSNLITKFGQDLGINVEVIITDKMPAGSLASDGVARVNNDGTGKIYINSEKVESSSVLIGTVFEEFFHIIDEKAGRQDKTVVEDTSNNEYGLESLGKPVNDYFKEKYIPTDKKIKLVSDGKDHINDDGTTIGESEGFAKLKGAVLDAVLGTDEAIINFEEHYKREFKEQEKYINSLLDEEDISSNKIHKELIELAKKGGTGYLKSPYEGLYVLENGDLRNKILGSKNEILLEKFDPKGWEVIENNKNYKEAIKKLKESGIKYFNENKEEFENSIKSKSNYTANKRTKSEIVTFVSDEAVMTKTDLEFALGKSTLLGRVVIEKGKPYLKYNLSDTFEDPIGIKTGSEKIISHASKAVGKNQNEIKKFREEFGVKIEWGKPYDMVGPSRMIPLFNMGE